MESLEQKSLIHELSQGKELTKNLISHLKPSSSKETRDLLVEQILSSYEKALSILRHNSLEKSPHSSPRSVIFEQESNPRDIFKKRKTMPGWTKQVKVCLGTGPEGPFDDGYNWRKYGQKDILGANHPRGYYRCTHRNSQGCLATKQVQKSDKDSSLFEVSYRGRHTCTQSSQFTNIISSNSSLLVKQEKISQSQSQSQSNSFNLKAGLEVKTDFHVIEANSTFPSFSFAPTPIGFENPFLSEAIIESGFTGGSENPFFSPATSKSNYFAGSSWHNVIGQGSDSDLNEILSAPGSVTNSPMDDLDLTISDTDFGLNFSFGSPELFTF